MVGVGRGAGRAGGGVEKSPHEGGRLAQGARGLGDVTGEGLEDVHLARPFEELGASPQGLDGVDEVAGVRGEELHLAHVDLERGQVPQPIRGEV